RRPGPPVRTRAWSRRAGGRAHGRCAVPGRGLRGQAGRAGALRRACRCRRGRCTPTRPRRVRGQPTQHAVHWRCGGGLRETSSVPAMAFIILAVLLAGPAPALLARATWPLRAPRAAMVLWQAVALAAVLSAFSAGIAIATRVLMPGPDGRPTASIIGAAGRLGWPLWTAYIAVFALTVLVGFRLMIAVVRVAIANRRRRAHHRMVVDLVGVGHDAALAH